MIRSETCLDIHYLEQIQRLLHWWCISGPNLIWPDRCLIWPKNVCLVTGCSHELYIVTTCVTHNPWELIMVPSKASFMCNYLVWIFCCSVIYWKSFPDATLYIDNDHPSKQNQMKPRFCLRCRLGIKSGVQPTITQTTTLSTKTSFANKPPTSFPNNIVHRKFNLVIYGVKENPKGTERRAQTKSDNQKCGQILKQADNDVSVQSIYRWESLIHLKVNQDHS